MPVWSRQIISFAEISRPCLTDIVSAKTSKQQMNGTKLIHVPVTLFIFNFSCKIADQNPLHVGFGEMLGQ